jgi:hypothetical protein
MSVKQGVEMDNVSAVLVWLYERVLVLYPRSIREKFGLEMAWVFARSVEDAARKGWGRRFVLSLGELRDLPGALAEAWTRHCMEKGLAVKTLHNGSSTLQECERIRWAPRLPQAVVVQLYAQDVQGIVDEALIDRVGAALDARADSILLVTRRRIRCPRCGVVFGLGDARQDEDLVRCPEHDCGWEATFRSCSNSWRRRHLFGGSMLPLLKAYRAEYDKVDSPQAKLQLIDKLLHAFGRDPRTGEIRWPSVGHLVEGKSPKAVALLEGLAYGEKSTPGLWETKQQWLKLLRLRRETALGAAARSGA